MRKPIEAYLTFPLRGIDTITPRLQQPQGTCVNCKNVRIFDALEERARGGIRPGLSKFNSTQVNGANRVQVIDYATTVSVAAPPTGSVGFRVVRPVAVAGGTIKTFDNGSTMNAATASGSRTLSNTAPFVMSAELFGRVYLTDGISYKIWVASNNTAVDWTPTTGNLPGTDGTRVARLITMWNARVVLSGLPDDPHNYFMSRISDPLDFDYTPTTTTEAQAVAGDVGVVGKMGDVINCIIPYNDDILIFGCDHSIYAMNGNPQAGGRYDLISDNIGMPFGMPYAMDATGLLYFFSTKGVIYRMDGPGSGPVDLSSESIGPEIDAIDVNTHFVRMAYDEKKKGLNVFFTPFTTGSTTHWFYDTRTNGWFRDIFANNDHNPIAVRIFDADDPNDRVTLLGSEDGYVRQIDDTVSNDDGTAINSFVIMGPLLGENKPIIITELQGNLDPDSSSMLYEIGVGNDPQAAISNLSSGFTSDGTLAAGRGVTHNPRQRAISAYVKVGNTSSATSWAFENIRVKYSQIGSRDRKHTEV